MRWFRWGDAIPILITSVAAIGWFWWMWQAPAGDCVTITTPTETYTLSLAEDTTLDIESGGHSLTIAVEQREVYVVSADCPDGVCVETGRISRTSQSIACVPSGVIVTIESATEPSVDAVTR